jgi:hypothetical protein
VPPSRSGTIGDSAVVASRLLSRPKVLLVLMVAFAAVFRTLVAWQQPTPLFFPDEIIYSLLARGIAETGEPLFLGQSLHFPAVLMPYVTAPFWLLEDTNLAYRLIQSVGAVSVSVAAVPVYVLCRRLSLSSSEALIVAGGVLVLPDLALASLLLSEPYAFLLFALTFLAAHRALRPVRRVRDQLLFLGLLGLLCLARTQFLYLAAAYLCALVLQGVLEGALRRTLREQLPILAAFALPIPALLILGVDRVLGFYGPVRDLLTPQASTYFYWLLANLLVLALSSGWVLAPGAVLGSVAALRASSNPSERTFVLLCIPIFVLQIAQAAIISAHVNDAQGRYLIYLLPLLLIFFALAVRRGIVGRWPYAVAVLALIPIALSAPIFELNRASINSAPILLSRYALEMTVGIPNAYASVPFLLAGLSIVTAYVWWKRSLPALIGVIGTFLLAASVGGNWAQRLLAHENVTAAHRPFLTSKKFDRALLLVGPGSEDKHAMGVVFWNREIAQVADLYQRDVRILPARAARAAPDGMLLVDGRPYSGDLVIDDAALRATIRGAQPARISSSITLVRATDAAAPVQLKTLATGARGLTTAGALRAWPEESGGRLRGKVTLSLSLPSHGGASSVVFRLPKGLTRSVPIAPGQEKTISFVIDSRGSWQSFFTARRSTELTAVRFDVTG